MKCPLSITGELTADKEFIGAAADCLKEECAWYRQQAEHCVLYVLAEDIRDLRDRMRTLVNEMPHERQFRK